MGLIYHFICPMGAALYLMCTSFLIDVDVEKLDCFDIQSKRWDSISVFAPNATNLTVPFTVDRVKCCVIELGFLEKNCLRVYLNSEFLYGTNNNNIFC